MDFNESIQSAKNTIDDTVKKMLSGLVVYLIDDSESLCDEICKRLRSFDCKIEVCNDPQKAICELDQIKPDILVIGCTHEVFAGKEALQIIRGKLNFQAVPILMIMDSNTPNELVLTLIDGADGCINKMDIPDRLIENLIPLARTRLLQQEAIRLRQFANVKKMIGLYKHEMVNALTILDGKIKRLERNHPSIATDVSLDSIRANLLRLEEAIKKLSQLRDYQEEPLPLYTVSREADRGIF